MINKIYFYFNIFAYSQDKIQIVENKTIRKDFFIKNKNSSFFIFDACRMKYLSENTINLLISSPYNNKNKSYESISCGHITFNKISFFENYFELMFKRYVMGRKNMYEIYTVTFEKCNFSEEEIFIQIEFLKKIYNQSMNLEKINIIDCNYTEKIINELKKFTNDHSLQLNIENTRVKNN